MATRTLLLLTAGFAAGAVFMWRWMWWVVAGLLASAMLVLVIPDQAGPIFGVASVLAMLDVAYFSYRRAA